MAHARFKAGGSRRKMAREREREREREGGVAPRGGDSVLFYGFEQSPNEDSVQRKPARGRERGGGVAP